MSIFFFLKVVLLLLVTTMLSVVNAHELADASGDCDVTRVKELLSQKADPNEPDDNGFTPLMRASKSGCFAIVQELIAGGADVNRKNEIYTISNTPLHVASEAGHVDIVRVLLMQGADANEVDVLGKTPLDLAQDKNHEEVIKVIQAGVPDLKGIELLKASEDGDIARVKELLEQGANPELHDSNGLTPLHYATTNERADILQLLLEYDADTDVQDKDGYTPLHWAAFSGYPDIVKELVTHGADPDVKNNDGKTAIDFASEESYPEIEEMLRKYQATRALSEAIQEGDVDTVNQILAQGVVDLDDPDEDGRTFLHWAVIGNYPKIVKALLDTGSVDPNAQDDEGMTPLHWASEKDYLDVVQQLLASPQTDPNLHDNEGFVPLHYALGHPTLDVLNVLLSDNKIDPNVSDEKGLTPLHYALIRDNLEHDRLAVINALLSNPKINPNLQDKILGNTPLHYATAKGFAAIVQALLGAGASPDVENKVGHASDESTHDQTTKALFTPKEQEPVQLLKNCIITRVAGSHNIIVEVEGLKIRRDSDAKASPWALEDHGTIEDATDASVWEIKIQNNDTFVKVTGDFLSKAELGQVLAKRLDYGLQIFELFPMLYDLAYPQSTELVHGTLPILPGPSQPDQEYILVKNRLTKHLGVKRDIGNNAWFIVFRPMEYSDKYTALPGSIGCVYDSINQHCYKMSIDSGNNVVLDLNGEVLTKGTVASAIKNINLELAFDIFRDYSAIASLRTSTAVCNLCMKIVQDALVGQTFLSSTIEQSIDDLINILQKLATRWSGQNIDQQEVSEYGAQIADHLKNNDVQALLLDIDQYKDKAWAKKIKLRAREASPLKEATKLDQVFNEKNDVKRNLMTNTIEQAQYEFQAWKGRLQLAQDDLDAKDAQQLKQSAMRANFEKMRQKIQVKNVTNPLVSESHDIEKKLGKLKDSLAKLHNFLSGLRANIAKLKKAISKP